MNWGLMLRVSALCALTLFSSAQVCAEQNNPFENVMPTLGKPFYFYQKDKIPNGAVLLFSDVNGWGNRELEIAGTLSKAGQLVIGIDTPSMLQHMASSTESCVNVIGEIENVSRNSQRVLGTPSYHFPVVAGIGLGATMAAAVASQTEPATLEHFSLVDPLPRLPGQKSLCALPGGRTPDVSSEGAQHFLMSGTLPFEINVLLSSKATEASRLWGRNWSVVRPDIVRVQESTLSPEAALLEGIQAALTRPVKPRIAALNSKIEDVSDLPLEEIPVTTPPDTFAVFYSGDGGWRDLDKDLSAYLKEDGLPVVGVDALRYFWHEQTPEQSTRDLERIIRSYQEKWGAKKVVLIGFSFGADLIPILYNNLSPEIKASVVQITLLGLSKDAIFEVSLDSWLNSKPADAPKTLPEVAKIKPELMQCFYGEEDTLNVCTQLEGTGIEVIRTRGGHHFNYEYQWLAKKIIERVERPKL